MDKQAVIRRVRIAGSMFFGVLAVALLLVWPRSYFWIDGISRGSTQRNYVGASTLRGVFRVSSTTYPKHLPKLRQVEWSVHSDPGDDATYHRRGRHFDWRNNENRMRGSVPLWFLITISSVVAVAMWRLQYSQFSLRTMLIAMTLVAVVLGLICYTGR
jgi:hypothetical protein